MDRSDARDLRGGGVQELLGLLHLQAVGRAAILAQLDQPQVVAADVAGMLGDFEFQILLPQREISRSSHRRSAK